VREGVSDDDALLVSIGLSIRIESNLVDMASSQSYVHDHLKKIRTIKRSIKITVDPKKKAACR